MIWSEPWVDEKRRGAILAAYGYELPLPEDEEDLSLRYPECDPPEPLVRYLIFDQGESSDGPPRYRPHRYVLCVDGWTMLSLMSLDRLCVAAERRELDGLREKVQRKRRELANALGALMFAEQDQSVTVRPEG